MRYSHKLAIPALAVRKTLRFINRSLIINKEIGGKFEKGVDKSVKKWYIICVG